MLTLTLYIRLDASDLNSQHNNNVYIMRVHHNITVCQRILKMFKSNINISVLKKLIAKMKEYNYYF